MQRVNNLPSTTVIDLFQESMLVAWRRLDECDLSRPFGPWLRGIAGRLILAHYRKRKALPVFLNEALLTHVGQQFESISTRPGDTWDEKVGAIRECIAALSESQRAVIDRTERDGTFGMSHSGSVTLVRCEANPDTQSETFHV